MRQRDESLRTGTLLVALDPDRPRHNASLLLLVEGAADIAPLRAIQDVCQEIIATDSRFQWHMVANQLELMSVEPRLDSSRVTRLEVSEFRGVIATELRPLLAPAIAQLQGIQRVRYPSATRTEGSVAKGVDFLDRQEELSELQQLVEAHQPVLLVAPRRSGKTSLLYRLAEQLGPQFRTELLDVEKFRDADAFTAELLVRAKGLRFVEALKQVRRENWRTALPGALAAMSSPSRPLVLLLDELAWFIENLEVAQARELLIVLDEALVKAGARLVVAGSLELERVVRERLRSPLPGELGRLTRFPLPPMARARLAVNLRRVLLGTGLVLQAGDMDWLLRNVDLAMPYPALRFLGRLASAAHAQPLSPSALEQELVDDLASTTAFDELEEQLKDLAQRDGTVAEAIEEALDRLSRAEGPVEVSDVKALLDTQRGESSVNFSWLVEHFPLHVEGERVELASRLFRRYWRSRGGTSP